jgi:hypothetical protein
MARIQHRRLRQGDLRLGRGTRDGESPHGCRPALRGSSWGTPLGFCRRSDDVAALSCPELSPAGTSAPHQRFLFIIEPLKAPTWEHHELFPQVGFQCLTSLKKFDPGKFQEPGSQAERLFRATRSNCACVISASGLLLDAPRHRRDVLDLSVSLRRDPRARAPHLATPRSVPG